MNPKINNDLSALRRKASEGSIYTFAKMYLSAHLKFEPSEAHKEIYTELQKASNNRGIKLAVAAPRYFGKSTLITLIYVLYSICYSKEKFIIIISNTASQAIHTLDNIKREFLQNERLREDFPYVFGDGQIKPGRWQQDDIITCNGIQIIALGSNQQIRGRRFGVSRPTLIIADDLENTKSILSSELRDKLKEQFNKAVLKAGSEETNFIFIGNLFHPHSLLSEYVSPNMNVLWSKKVYSAICVWPIRMDLWDKCNNIRCGKDKSEGDVGPLAARKFYEKNAQLMNDGAKLLWPSRYDLYELMEMYYENELSFMSEMQNEPRNPKDCPFNVDKFKYWSDSHSSTQDLLRTLGEGVNFFGACDPSMATSSNGDYSAIVVLARTEEGDLYIVEADIKRRQPNAIIDDIVAYHRAYSFQLFAVESNNFQELMIRQLETKAKEMKQYISIERVKNTSNKEARIKSLQPLFHNGTVCFNRNDLDLLKECLYFPKGKNDDGLDALEMAVRISEELPRVQTFTIGRDRDDDGWYNDYRKNFGWPSLY